MAHLLLPVHLLLGPQLLRSGFATDSLLALAKPQNFWLEERVLDSLRKVHILFIVHPGVVLDGLAVQLHQLVHCFDIKLTRIDLELVVQDQGREVLRQLLRLGAHDFEVALLLLGVLEQRFHAPENTSTWRRLLLQFLLLLAPSGHLLVTAERRKLLGALLV